MSFQAYLDTIEKKTGKTRGGHRHAPDESDVLRLDGIANRDQPVT